MNEHRKRGHQNEERRKKRSTLFKLTSKKVVSSQVWQSESDNRDINKKDPIKDVYSFPMVSSIFLPVLFIEAELPHPVAFFFITYLWL